MSDLVRTPEMTVDEFFAFLEHHPDRRFDFTDGELVEVSPKPLHGRLQAALAGLLITWAEENNMGIVHTETLHILNGTMFMPNISVNAALADDQSSFDTPPLLAVEIRSDTHSRVSQRRKALHYIQLGTPAVLLILPDEQIELYTASMGDNPKTYLAGDILENIPELPGLRFDVVKFIG